MGDNIFDSADILDDDDRKRIMDHGESRMPNVKVRNAITESQANGYSIAAIAREHGLSEAEMMRLLERIIATL